MKHKWTGWTRQMIALSVAFSLLMSSAFATAYDAESLKEEMSSHLVNFEQQFEVDYVGNIDAAVIEKLKPSIDEAMDSVPYIANQLDSYSVSMSYSSKQATLKFNVVYLTSLERENVLNQKLAEAILAMGLTGLSDYQKVKRIADWISDRYSYDDSLSIHSASEMSEKGVGVCQAYASMFYKMARAAGLEVVYQSGTLEGGAHLWNLVNIGGKWYHVDVTNYDANDRRILLMVGTSELKPLAFNFTAPSFTIEEDSRYLDQRYDNGLYDANLVSERLKLSAYKSQGFTADYAQNKAVDTLYQQLDTASAKLISKPTKENYNALRQLISKAEVLQMDTSQYSAAADNVSLVQYNLAKGLIAKAAVQIKALKGSKYSEKSALAVLKYVEDTRLKVKAANILDSHSAYLDGQVSVLGKEAAYYLLQSYYGSYKKSGSSSWLTKIKSINGKYGISISIK